MANVKVQDVLDAARQLTPRQRGRVLDELQRMATSDEALKVARRLRGKYKLPPPKQRRLSRLLRKNNEDRLTAAETSELQKLLEECDSRSLAMADELVRTVKPPRGSGNGKQ
jgi:hypothetical protein